MLACLCGGTIETIIILSTIPIITLTNWTTHKINKIRKRKWEKHRGL